MLPPSRPQLRVGCVQCRLGRKFSTDLRHLRQCYQITTPWLNLGPKADRDTLPFAAARVVDRSIEVCGDVHLGKAPRRDTLCWRPRAEIPGGFSHGAAQMRTI